MSYPQMRHRRQFLVAALAPSLALAALRIGTMMAYSLRGGSEMASPLAVSWPQRHHWR